MSPDLDNSKPLRLIGVQIFEDTSLEIRKSLLPGWYPFIKCSNDNEMGTNRDVFPILAQDVCPTSYYTIDERLPLISISAIVGKNGSGKSTLIEIVYRFISNFSNVNSSEDNKIYAYKLFGRLYFEFDGITRFIECKGNVTKYYIIKDNNLSEVSISFQDQGDNQLFEFFYTICINYSLYAYNPKDYEPSIIPDGKIFAGTKWLNSLFDESNIPYSPIVITPRREKGKIDINEETDFSKRHIEVLSLLLYSQNKELLPNYDPYRLWVSYDSNFLKSHDFTNTISDYKSACKLLVNIIAGKWESYLIKRGEIKIDKNNKDYQYNDLFIFLAEQTLTVLGSNKDYNRQTKFYELKNQLFVNFKSKQRELKDPDDFPSPHKDYDKIENEIAKKWYSDNVENITPILSSIHDNPNDFDSIIIFQCLNYIKGSNYERFKKSVFDVKNQLLKEKKYEKYSDILKFMPPPFFKTELRYKKKGRSKEDNADDEISLHTLSSGERQLLYSLSSIFYHINRISSPIEGDRSLFNYHHINLIFDEAELYYHPEFQRKFVKKLLEHLSYCNIDTSIIRSINIIIVTHSPFILSDIPQSNVLFLGNKEEYDGNVPQTLGANIYDLLKSGFFLDYAIGDVIQMKLQEILDLFYMEGDRMKKKQLFEQKKDDIWYTIDHLGEDYLKSSFISIYEQMENQLLEKSHEDLIKERIDYYKNQLSKLEQQIKNNEKV